MVRYYGPVSYTHLDVYKRQYEELISNFGKHDKDGKVKKHFEELKKKSVYTYRIEVTLKDNRSFSSVSYTHLEFFCWCGYKL